MDDLRTLTAAHAGGTFTPLVRMLAAAASACWKALHAALHESREREAMRVIARYRHLSEDAEQFFQREIAGLKSETTTPSCQETWPLYIDSIQGTR